MSEWVTITEAALKLGVGTSVVSRVVKDNHLKTIKNPVDKRTKLVDLEEVAKLFKRPTG